MGVHRLPRTMKILLALISVVGVSSLTCGPEEREFKGQCHQQFDKDACPKGQWLSLQDCQEEVCPITRKCMDGFVRRNEDKECYQLHTQGYCDEGNIIAIVDTRGEKKIRCLFDPCQKGEGQIAWRDGADYEETGNGIFSDKPSLNKLQRLFLSRQYFREHSCV